VPLRGLTAEEVQRMMASVAQREIPWAFAELLHRQTEGNPLFVQEMLRYLVEEGLVSEQQGTLRRVGDESLAGRIPEGLRDVIGKRLSRLSDKTNQVLSVAAVIGREFRLDVLQTVAGLTDDEMDTALEQAQDRAIVEQRSTVGTLVFRFTHAFFRQTLYEEIFASRRLRLHQQVARALEQVYGVRVEEHAAELAEHFAQSTDPTDLGKALQYSELAARRSMQVFAYGEAARQLDGALKVQEVLDPDGSAKRCDLLIATAEALLPAEEPGRVPEGVALDAFVLAQKLGDGARAAQAALLAIEALFRLRGGGSEPATHADFREWVARLDMYAAPGSVARVYADVYAGMATIPENRSEGHKLLRRASDLATEMADERAFYAAAGWVMRFLLAAQDRERVEVLVDGIIGRPHVGVRPTDLAICYRAAGDVLLERGDRAGAVKLWDGLAVLASANRDATITRWAKEPSALFAFIDGRLQDAVDIGHELQDQSPSTPGEHYRLARSLLYLKGSEAALAVNLTGLMGMGRPQRAAVACWMAHLGRKDEARALIHEFGDVSSDSDESATVLLYFLLEAALLLQDKDLARGLARRLSPFAGFSCARYVCSSYGRLLGGAAALLGEPEQARKYYTQTIVACQKIGFRPEIALIRLELGELMLGHYSAEKSAALQHLDFAIDEFRDMKMQPSLERALKHKGLLHA
jgi:tetratricopeptide (TPR) repeat protein